jgi:hypothetical protein
MLRPIPIVEHRPILAKKPVASTNAHSLRTSQERLNQAIRRAIDRGRSPIVIVLRVTQLPSLTRVDKTPSRQLGHEPPEAAFQPIVCANDGLPKIVHFRIKSHRIARQDALNKSFIAGHAPAEAMCRPNCSPVGNGIKPRDSVITVQGASAPKVNARKLGGFSQIAHDVIKVFLCTFSPATIVRLIERLSHEHRSIGKKHTEIPLPRLHRRRPETRVYCAGARLINRVDACPGATRHDPPRVRLRHGGKIYHVCQIRLVTGRYVIVRQWLIHRKRNLDHIHRIGPHENEAALHVIRGRGARIHAPIGNRPTRTGIARAKNHRLVLSANHNRSEQYCENQRTSQPRAMPKEQAGNHKKCNLKNHANVRTMLLQTQSASNVF